jgi:predicted N-acyltransferase
MVAHPDGKAARRERVRLATLTAEFETSIERFGRALWDDPFESPEFDLLRVLERQPRRAGQYAILFDGERPIARLVVSTIEHSPSRLQRVMGRAALLVTLPAGGLAFRLAQGLDPVAVGPRVGDALRALARRERRLFAMVAPAAEREAEALKHAGFATSPAPGSMKIRLPATYDEYLKRLSQRHRKDVRRLRRRAEEAGHRFECHEAWDYREDELFELFVETMERHGLERGSLPLDASYLTELKRMWGADLRLFTASREGRLVAYLAVQASGKLARVSVPGIRYAEARPFALYLLLWQEVLAWAIDQGVETLDGGTQMVREKARMGFEERRLMYAYATVSPRLDAVLERIRPWLERRVFSADLDAKANVADSADG